MATEAQVAKQRLRDQVLAARLRLTAAELDDAGEAIAAHGLRQWSGVPTVAAYLAVGSEPPTLPLLKALRRTGTRVLLPVISGDDLQWAVYDGEASLRAGPLGINEPTGPRLGAAALTTAEAVLLPALAVDRQGRRLGRGRGYYDRALATTTATLVAVVFDTELVEHVPTEPHDRRVDASLRQAGLAAAER